MPELFHERLGKRSIPAHPVQGEHLPRRSSHAKTAFHSIDSATAGAIAERTGARSLRDAAADGSACGRRTSPRMAPGKDKQ